MSDLCVIRIGAPVTLGGGIPAVVTAVCIRYLQNVTYEVTWWDGRTRKVEWMTPDEIVTTKADISLRVGFVPPSGGPGG